MIHILWSTNCSIREVKSAPSLNAKFVSPRAICVTCNCWYNSPRIPRWRSHRIWFVIYIVSVRLRACVALDRIRDRFISEIKSLNNMARKVAKNLRSWAGASANVSLRVNFPKHSFVCFCMPFPWRTAFRHRSAISRLREHWPPSRYFFY